MLRAKACRSIGSNKLPRSVESATFKLFTIAIVSSLKDLPKSKKS
jgi:hypothetical protein